MKKQMMYANKVRAGIKSVKIYLYHISCREVRNTAATRG